jgi:hypothetical protein
MGVSSGRSLVHFHDGDGIGQKDENRQDQKNGPIAPLLP